MTFDSVVVRPPILHCTDKNGFCDIRAFEMNFRTFESDSDKINERVLTRVQRMGTTHNHRVRI